nr:uncharacterized mitochondrial protein AtMg00810-like [Tanacetum cinerariifolium]
FLKTKDETSGILRNFITEIENLKELKVKIIRCDNGGEFRNKEMNDLCLRKGIKREFSNARTPQQNGVAKRRIRTLIEAARTMLADAKLPVTFSTEAVNTACYVRNKVLVNKSQNKTLYELFNGRTPSIGFLKPFGCHVIILNTLDHLWKFDAKGDEGYFIGYSMSSKAFRIFNKRTKKVEENLHVDFLENKLIEKGAGPNWLFDIDTLTNSMNYMLVVVAGTSSTNFSGTKDAASQDVKQDVSSLRYIALPNWFHKAHLESSTSNAQDACNADAPESSGNSNPTATSTNPPADQMETLTVESVIPTVCSLVPTACLEISPETTSGSRLISKRVTSQDETPSLDNISTLSSRFEDILGVTTIIGDTNGVEADLGNMEYNISASPTLTFRIHKDHPKNPEFPDRVYKVEKEMYRLHQAPKAWYGTVSKYLLTNSFQRGTIDQTLFIKRHRGYFILVQVYVDDIIFGSSNLQLCREFEALMHEKFQMSAMGKLNFFLGLCQVSQYSYRQGESLRKDRTGKDVDLHLYRSMIGSLMYLTTSRPDIMFVVCACARHQVTPKECHLHAVKRIFRYLKGHPKLGLWYPKDSPFDLVAYSDSDYGGATQDRKSTTGGYALTINPTVYVSHIRQFWSIARIETTNEGTKILTTVDNEPASPLGDDSQGKAFPTVSGLEAGQDRENIIMTSALPYDSTPRVTSLAADEGNMQQQLYELTDLCTGLQRIKLLEDKESAELSRDDAPIKGRSLETGDEVGVERSTKRVSNDIEELVNVLTSLDVVNILTSGVQAVSVPLVTEIPTVGVPTGSGLVPTASPILTTASVSNGGRNARDAQRKNEQIARDAEIARIHAKEELQMMIDGLDRNNEVIAKHLQEYEESKAELTIEEKIDLINELGSAKKMKTSEEITEEDLKEMMQLVPVEEVYVEALQVKHPIIDWEIHTEGKRDYWKIIRLGGHTAGRIVRNKMLKSFPLPVKKIPLSEYFPTASEERFPLLSIRDAPTEEVCTAKKLSINNGQRHIYTSQRCMSVIPGMCPMIDPMI